jgi:hypothetical protein
MIIALMNIRKSLLAMFLRLKNTSSTAWIHRQHAENVNVSFMMPEPQNMAEGMYKKPIANFPEMAG